MFLTMLQPHVPAVPGVLIGWLRTEDAGDVHHPSWPHATSQRLGPISGDAWKGRGDIVEVLVKLQLLGDPLRTSNP